MTYGQTKHLWKKYPQSNALEERWMSMSYFKDQIPGMAPPPLGEPSAIRLNDCPMRIFQILGYSLSPEQSIAACRPMNLGGQLRISNTQAPAL